MTMMLDQRELNFAGFVGLADRPIAAANFTTDFRRSILGHEQNNARRED
jgi:hypothetical protein